MKKIWIILAAAASLSACDQQGQSSKYISDAPLQNMRDSASYSFGVQVGQNILNNQPDVDMGIVLRAMGQTLMKDSLEMPEALVGPYYMSYLDHKFEAENKDKKEAAEAYMEEHATTEGVTVTESGLHIETIEPGNGATPDLTNYVKVHYTGTFTDGRKFDSSYDTPTQEPAMFRVTGVIRGWTEGLQQMQEGGKYRLTIPYELAYGPRGQRSIPPYSVLVFEMELIDVLTREEYEVERQKHTDHK